MTELDLLADFTNDAIPADKNVRFLNWLIDTITFYIISVCIGVVIGILAPEMVLNSTGTGSSLVLQLISLLVYVAYFSIFEGLSDGKTLGKIITKTRAIKTDGSAFTFSDAIKRSLSRIVPFEPFSGFGSSLWHDKWTDTIVVKENNK